MEDRIKGVRGFIVEMFMWGDGEKLKYETKFIDSGIVDSLGMLEVVGYIEETFDIKVLDTELTPENLSSLKNIDIFLDKKINK